MMVSSETSPTTEMRLGSSERLAQCDTGLLGSASMMVTAPPRLASSDASSTADVDLPAPPLGVRNTIVGMTDTTKFGMTGPENTLWLVEAQEDSESSQSVVRILPDNG